MKDLFICKNCEFFQDNNCTVWMKQVANNDYCSDFELSEEVKTDE